MPEFLLPRMGGVLAAAFRPRPARWQRNLASLSIPEGALALADELARIPQGLAPEAREDLTLLLLLLLGEQARGCTYLALDDPERADRALAALEGSQPPPWARLLALLERPELGVLVAGPAAATPLVLDGRRLSSRRFHRSEQRLAGAIRARLRPPGVPPAIPERLLLTPDPLDPAQRSAVRLALASPLALVTGGPGTGKTSIVVAMLRALLHSGSGIDDILLAAPTGKAAQRMGQSLRDTLLRVPDRDAVDDSLLERLREPQTLHRLLGWLPRQGGFRHHAGNVLAASTVVVDEASMISQELMEALLLALPAGASLVLLGDENQLPSVEAGQAFRDLVDAVPAGCRQHLATSHRTADGGEAIANLAKVVQEGPPDPGPGALAQEQALEALRFRLWEGPAAIARRTTLQALRFEGVELLPPTRAIMEAFLARWMRERIWTLEQGAPLDTLLYPPFQAPAPGAGWSPDELARIAALTAHYNRSRILCPVNTGPDLMSVDSLNGHLHRMALDRVKGLAAAPDIIVGEPVMVTGNDYRRDLFNGDQGLVLMVSRDGASWPEVFFPRGGGYASFPLATLRETLTLCYAMTIHKSQGSEYAQIALVISEAEGEFLTRGLLYTGLTRARKVVTILADPATWERGTCRKEQRRSRLASLIRDP